MTTPDAKPDEAADKVDLDTLIRQAEAKVVAADRQWQLHGEALSVSLRSHAGTAAKVGTWGGIGLALTAAAGGLYRWRSATRARAEAKTVAGRAKGMARGIAQSVAAKWAGRSGQPAVSPVRRSTPPWLEAVVTTAGLLLGAAARSGLKTKGRPGVTPLLVSVGLPMLSRWWRSRQPPPG